MQDQQVDIVKIPVHLDQHRPCAGGKAWEAVTSGLRQIARLVTQPLVQHALQLLVPFRLGRQTLRHFQPSAVG